ncbi:MAG: hypothetical protein JKY53_04075 [Flavobacteriales bacterium]|nr:hypothetical protein [Flavobacteriales bacterium]
MKKTVLASLGLFLSLISLGQNLGLEEWQYHIPYQNGIAVSDAGNLVYCASYAGMYYFNKSDNSVNRFTRIQGLSDIGITDIVFAEETDILVVGYENGNIDLVQLNSVINISGIKDANFPGTKRINKITIIDELAYLSCGFGIVVVDLLKQEIRDTYYLNSSQNLGVNDIVVNGIGIYAATNSGLFFSEFSNNLSDPEQWKVETDLPDSTFSRLFFFQEKLYANYSNNVFKSDTLFYLENGTWKKQQAVYNQANAFFDVLEDRVVVCHTYKIVVYDGSWNTIQELTTYGQIAPAAKQAVFDENDPSVIWAADSRKGLIKITGDNQYEAHTVLGPPSRNSHEITSHGSDVWIASGSIYGGLWSNTYNKDGVFKFSENEWKIYSKETLDGIDSLFDFLSVAIDPINQDKVFFAVHGDGIVEVINDVHTETYGQSNSSVSLVEGATPDYQYAGMTSLTFDGNNILWGANARAKSVLCAKDQGENWYSFDLSSVMSNKRTGRMIATSNNIIWVALPKNAGIVVLNYNNTIADTTDDQMIGLTTTKGGLSSNTVLDLVEDLDGEIWVGTAEGVVVFRSPSDLFGENPSDAEKILIQQDGYTEYLLETQTVTAITIDGANRKWIGTSSSGVYLIAEDGTEEILHFTVENSPLISNIILTIGVNHETGEVFFGTDQGVCSYKSTATGGTIDYSQVYAYPNPVTPDYYGDIAIKGLVTNSEIRITDINGYLVYKGVANGGQAIWNGQTTSGDRVKTGVYLVFCATPDGSQSVATKILFIN